MEILHQAENPNLIDPDSSDEYENDDQIDDPDEDHVVEEFQDHGHPEHRHFHHIMPEIRHVPFENQHGAIRGKLHGMFESLGIYLRVVLLFILDGLLNGTLVKHFSSDSTSHNSPAVTPLVDSFLTKTFIAFLFIATSFLFLLPTIVIVDVFYIFFTAYGPIWLAYQMNNKFIQSLVDSTLPEISSRQLRHPDVHLSLYFIFIVFLAWHLDVTLIQVNLPPVRRWMRLVETDTRPPSIKTKVFHCIWFVLRLSMLLSLLSPVVLVLSGVPPKTLDRFSLLSLYFPSSVFTIVLLKRIPFLLNQWSKFASWVQRSVEHFGFLNFVEEQWTILTIPVILRTFFLVRVFYQMLDLFVLTGISDNGYTLTPNSNPLTTLSNISTIGNPSLNVSKVLTSFSSLWSNQSQNIPGPVRNSTLEPSLQSDCPAVSFLQLVLPSLQTCPANSSDNPSVLPFSPARILLVSSADTVFALLGFTSWVSYIASYLGNLVQLFLDQDDAELDGGNMGIVAAVLFFILGIQTGLTGMRLDTRLIRLYKNFSLLGVALLHYVHSLVSPQLEALSASPFAPFSRYGRTFLVSFLLIFTPLYFIYYLWSRYQPSTWLLAVTAFGLELVIKVVVSLAVYLLFLIDTHREDFWEQLDDYIYWVRAVGSSVEFLFGVFLFCNGAWIMFFESGGSIRAIMMCIHAYYNIFQQARDGWKTFNKRRQSVNKIDSMRDATPEQLKEINDVCSICYHELGSAKITSCNHYFHGVCLRKWLYLQDNCPLCHRNMCNGRNSDSNGAME